MRALVTGFGGFVGTNLTQRLLRDGVSVIGIDKAPRYLPKHKQKSFKIVIENLNKINSFCKLFKKPDIVYHLAASADIRRSGHGPWMDFEDNVKATINLLEYMRKKDVKEIKFISSSAVYGYHGKFFNEMSEFNPINLYGSSKVACEGYIKAYADLYGMKYTIFRPAQIVGDYEHRGVIVDFFNKLKKNPKELEILGDGNQTKSYFHVSDCIEAILKLRGDIFNLANTDEIKVKDLAMIVIKELNLNPRITYTGGDRGWLGDTPFYHLSLVRAFYNGWEPKYNCEESIRLTVRWLNDKYNNTNKK